MRAVLSEKVIRIYDAYLYREAIKQIPGRHYDAEDKAWVVPLTEENVAKLQIYGASMEEELTEILQANSPIKKDEEPISKMRLKVKAYCHQIAAFNYTLRQYEKGKGVAMLADMGTGKTLITISVAGALQEKGIIKRMLVVAPKSIVPVWRMEFQKFADFRYAFAELDGDITKKRAALGYMTDAKVLQVVAVSYESCWRLEKEITKWKPDFIVCDESLKIKNPMAKQAKALHNLGKLSKKNMILTGTFITCGPLDAFSQYKFVDENIFGASFYNFRSKYAIIGGFKNKQVVGYKNMDDFVRKIHSIAFRIRLEDAVDMPPYIDETRYVTLEPSAKAMYDQLEKDSYMELEQGEITMRNVLTLHLRLAQFTGGFLRSDDGGLQQVSSAKLEALEDIVDSCIAANRKVAVFARFVPEIEAISKMLKDKGIDHSVIMGSVQDRAEQVRRFQEEPEVKVFIGQLQTASKGLTLTAASVEVFYSLDFSFENYDQSRRRIYRIGQKKKCLYIHLVCKGTDDEWIMDVIKHKGNVSKLVTDEWRALVQKKQQKREE